MPRRGVWCLVATLTLVAAGCSSEDDARPTTSSSDTAVTEPPATAVDPAPHGRSFVYQPGVRLTLMGPEGCPDGPRPVMVALSPWLLEGFVERGYVGVVVDARIPDYQPRFDERLVHAVGWAVHDTAIAIQWIRAHASEHCLDPDAVAAAGHSFGAIAALALAYSEGEADAGSITIEELGGTIEVEPVDRGPVPPELAPYSNDPDAVVSFAGFALAESIDAGEPPVIMFHGRNDPTVPFALAGKTCDAARAVGVTCELVAHDGGHSAAPDLEAALDQAVHFLDQEMLEVAPVG